MEKQSMKIRKPPLLDAEKFDVISISYESVKQVNVSVNILITLC